MDSAALLTRLVEDLVDSGPRAAARGRVTGTAADGSEQVFAVAAFATTDGELITELTQVWTDVDEQAPSNTRPQPERVLPDPTARLRFRAMSMADFDAMTAVLSAPDPVRIDRPVRTRDDAVRWIEWQERAAAA